MSRGSVSLQTWGLSQEFSVRFPSCHCLSYCDIKFQWHLVVYLRSLSMLTLKRLSPSLGPLWSHSPTCHHVPALAVPKHYWPSFELNKLHRHLPKVREITWAAAEPAQATLCSSKAALGLQNRESHKCINVALVKTHYSALSAVGESGSEQVISAS